MATRTPDLARHPDLSLDGPVVVNSLSRMIVVAFSPSDLVA